MIRPVGFMLALLMAAPAYAAPYEVDYTASRVEFAGQHAGTPFSGKFTTWSAEIDFDPANPATGNIRATFDTSTAETGNRMYDGTLPQADWFDVKQYPRAEFVSTSIEATEDGGYRAIGDLTLRDVTHPVTFDFKLTDPTHPPLQATGSFTIDRLLYDIGKGSDPKAEWVDKDITVTLTITASAK